MKFNLPLVATVVGFVLMIAGHSLVGSIISGAAFLYICFGYARASSGSSLAGYLFQNWFPALITISSIAGGFYDGVKNSDLFGVDPAVAAVRARLAHSECPRYFEAGTWERLVQRRNMSWCRQMKQFAPDATAAEREAGIRAMRVKAPYLPEIEAAFCSDYYSALREGRVRDVYDLEWCEFSRSKVADSRSRLVENEAVKRIVTSPTFSPDRMKDLSSIRNQFALTWDEVLNEKGLLDKVTSQIGIEPIQIADASGEQIDNSATASTGNLWK